MKAKFVTVLQAEDGVYTREHATYAEALDYVHYQMGENPLAYAGAWYDDCGRSITIESLEGDENES